jgi:hypothetical protein
MPGGSGNDTAGPGLRLAGRVTAPALRGLGRFAESRGVPGGWEFLLDYDVIEAFCVTGLAGRAPATRAPTGQRCTGSRAAVHGPPGQRPTPFAGAKAPAAVLSRPSGGAGRGRAPRSRPGETLLRATR